MSLISAVGLQRPQTTDNGSKSGVYNTIIIRTYANEHICVILALRVVSPIPNHQPYRNMV